MLIKPQLRSVALSCAQLNEDFSIIMWLNFLKLNFEKDFHNFLILSPARSSLELIEHLGEKEFPRK